MASPPYGYAYGPQLPVPWLVDSATSDIKIGDMLVQGTAGYAQQAAAGDNIPIGWAMTEVDAPSADGDATVLVDMSEHSVYYIQPDAGSVTQALAGQTCDIGGAQTADIDASADDVIYIRGVDVDNNALYVSLIHKPAGVI